MNYLIIGCHPYEESFNASAIKQIWEQLNRDGNHAEFVDLVADGFNPVMTADDLKLWREGKFDDGLVGKYQTAIEKCDVMVFMFPLWWGYLPAVLKGFCDKVLLPGFAYKHNNEGQMIGLLPEKKAIVITTMETQRELYEDYYKEPIRGGFIMNTLQACGVELLHYLALDRMATGGRQYAEEMMERVLELFKEREPALSED